MSTIIIVDPGHGGADPGTYHRRIKHFKNEAQIVLEVCRKLTPMLTRMGHTVRMTHNGLKPNERMLPGERVAFANKTAAKLFISVHCNGVDNPQANGMEIIHATGSRNGTRLASLTIAEMAKAFPRLTNRGLKASWSPGYPRNIMVVQKTRMPAILVELAFLTNDVEGALLQEPCEHDKWALSIANGVERYLQ